MDSSRLKGKESKVDLKLPGEEQSRKEIKTIGLTWGEAEMTALDNWLETESEGLMLRVELRARRREDNAFCSFFFTSFK